MNLMLKYERLRHGWSQDYVSDQIGVARSMVQMLETGQRRPSYPVLVKLENLFGMTHRELFTPINNKGEKV